MNFTGDFQNLPDSLQKFLRHLVPIIKPDQIYLFGSRARGDHRINSDYDLAVQKINLNPTLWSRILTDLEHENFTLNKVDLVHLESLDESYKSNIKKEGRLLYG